MRASQNMIKAIEQGIITEMTKTRLRELEAEINQYDFDIEREKQRTYTYLTIENIEAYLQSKLFANPEDIKIRKLSSTPSCARLSYTTTRLLSLITLRIPSSRIKSTPKPLPKRKGRSTLPFLANRVRTFSLLPHQCECP